MKKRMTRILYVFYAKTKAHSLSSAYQKHKAHLASLILITIELLWTIYLIKSCFYKCLWEKSLFFPSAGELSAIYIIKLYPSGNSHFALHNPREWRQASAKSGDTALALPLLSMEEQNPEIYHSDHFLWFTDVFTCCLSSSFLLTFAQLSSFTTSSVHLHFILKKCSLFP